MTYFVIYNNEDGEVTVYEVGKEQLLTELQTGNLGKNPDFYDSVPNDGYVDSWSPDKMLIIKGEIVVPKAVQVATRYEL